MAYVNVLSGKETVTDYAADEQYNSVFYNGMAHRKAGGLYGYIDRDLQPGHRTAFCLGRSFFDGKAAVLFPNFRRAVIDREG
jgi:hypothetical protein